MFKKNEKDLIEFIAKVKGLSGIDEIKPVKSNKFIPQWWKNAPYEYEDADKYRPKANGVKQCPAFPDLFSSGYILPMWADTTIFYDDETKEWSYRCGAEWSSFKISIMTQDKFIDVSSYKYKGMEATAIFQFSNPWTIKVPKGYSVFQLPLFYENDREYSALPGIFDGFISEQGQIEIAYFGNKKEIFIKKGTPLVQYIPYKRTKLDLNVRELTEEDSFKFATNMLNRETMFKNWYAKNRLKDNLTQE
jgi:hypothetical protein